MAISSISSIFRHRFFYSTYPCNALRRVSVGISRSKSITVLAGDIPDRHHKTPPNRNLLKAKDSIKELSPLSHDLNSQNFPNLEPNQAVGFVAAAQANFMRVIVQSTGASGEQTPQLEKEQENPISHVGVEILCVVRALLKKIGRRVLVGDKVLVGSVDWVDRRGMIENVFTRRTETLDPPVANVDHLLVLFSMEQPKLEPFPLTRFLVEAESTGIPFTLALNKCELVDREVISDWKKRLISWGYEPIFCSVQSRCGMGALGAILKEQTSVIIGPSGVGKSSLINFLRSSESVALGEEKSELFPHETSAWFHDQRVAEVSIKSGRGKHTTRNVSLLPLSDGGYLADTPGFSQPSLIKVTKKSLCDTFPEIRQKLMAKKCSFKDCLHLGELGCAIQGDWERYPYYLQLLDEIKIREEFQLRTLGTKRESDVRYKMGEFGVKLPEPRLEPKKHRRVSRKRLNQSILDEYDEFDDVNNEEDGNS